jgi:hypothetical protein
MTDRHRILQGHVTGRPEPELVTCDRDPVPHEYHPYDDNLRGCLNPRPVKGNE